MSDVASVVAALEATQEALGDSDGQFARRMAVDRETWRKIRTGQMPPGLRTLQGAAAAFPDLRELLTAFFLGSDASIHASSDSKLTPGEAVQA